MKTNCYTSFTQEAWNFFDIPENSNIYIWPIGGENDDGADTPFLVEHEIKGYVLPDNISMFKKFINSKVKLNFTGRVYKKKPDWAEKNLGGSKESIHIEVTIEGNNYLIFDMYIPKHIKEKLSKKCTFN
ncbi:MAG: hypothetical protein MJK15_09615 [Colwellia sp.]|nr:hypothetical protein [Colwellia sp.]